MSNPKKAVVGLVNNYSVADQVVSELTREGFASADISALFPDMRSNRDFAFEKHTKAPEGSAVGAGIGGLAGGALGLLAGIGALAIPGLGFFIAVGPIMAALAGVGAGGVVGGLTGVLVGLGIPELEAKKCEARVKNGAILMSVHVESDMERVRAQKVMKSCGAHDIATLGELAAT